MLPISRLAHRGASGHNSSMVMVRTTTSGYSPTSTDNAVFHDGTFASPAPPAENPIRTDSGSAAR